MKKNSRKTILTVIGILAGLCVICVIGVLIYNSTPAGKAANATSTQQALALVGTETARPNPTNLPPATSVPTLIPPTPTVTSIPTPMITLSPLDALKANISAALGEGNRKVPRLDHVTMDDQKGISVQFAINDNLTENLIIFGAKEDVLKIIKTVHDSSLDYSAVGVVGTFSMQDAYGNVTEDKVVRLDYDKATIDKINWDNFLSDNVYTIADLNLTNALFNK